MKAFSYISPECFKLVEKQWPCIKNPTDAIVRVTLASICSSDIHIKHGAVPRAVMGVTVGHEMVGIVEKVGSKVRNFAAGDSVTVNVETFCGECFFCQNGFVNNCTDPEGGWALGCRIDGGLAEAVRIPLADNCLNHIPDNVSDEQALFVGDILATGFWATKISEITPSDSVVIIGAGPTGLCTLLCARLKRPARIIICEKDPSRRMLAQRICPEAIVVASEDLLPTVAKTCPNGGADRVIEVAGSDESFRLAWQAARPNAIISIIALYENNQILPLPQIYGKNLTFKTGGVDGCDCDETLALISEGKIDTTPLLSHRFPLSRVEDAFELFESKASGVIKTAIYPDRF